MSKKGQPLKKWRYEDVKDFIENYNCKLINKKEDIINTKGYVNLKNKLDIKCSCGENFKNTFDSFRNRKHKMCNKCATKIGASKQSLKEEEIIQKIKNALSDNYLFVGFKNEEEIKTTASIVYIKHLECGEVFERAVRKIIYNENQFDCGFCGYGIKELTKEIAEYKFYKYVNKKNFTFIDLLEDNKIKFKCNECENILTRNLGHIKESKGANCIKCKSSKGVRAISNYLEDNNIEFIREYRFEDCKFNRTLPFDFYLPKYNICIEFDGFQHDKSVSYWGGEEKFELTKIRDEIKNNYCKDNNIILIRINQTQYDNKSYLRILDKIFNR